MPSSSRAKINGARLRRLIIDVGTDTMRNYFDSKCPSETLTDVLYANYDTLRRNNNRRERQKLFPPTGVLPAMPSTSKDYDITLLFSLLRNICGLIPPASTGWNEPSPEDTSEAADLIRIKYYRNELSHIAGTQVSDNDFLTNWNEISEVLVRRGANAADIVKLMTSPISENYYASLLA